MTPLVSSLCFNKYIYISLYIMICINRSIYIYIVHHSFMSQSQRVWPQKRSETISAKGWSCSVPCEAARSISLDGMETKRTEVVSFELKRWWFVLKQRSPVWMKWYWKIINIRFIPNITGSFIDIRACKETNMVFWYVLMNFSCKQLQLSDI